MTRSGLLLALLAAVPAAAANAPMARLTTLQDQSFGVLLLGDGGDKAWKESLAAAAKKFSPQFPFEFAAGGADSKAIQKAVDRLKTLRIKKLVVVPLFAASQAPLLDQLRFLFGIRELPSEEFFQASRTHSGYAIVRRIQTKLPVVMTPPPDDHPLVVEVLASRALSLSKNPAAEVLVLVGLAPPSGPPPAPVLGRRPGTPVPAGREEEYRQVLSALAERVRANGGFQAAHAALLQPEALHQSQRARHEEELRRLVQELSRRRRVLVIPHAVTGEAASRHILRALTGAFMRYNNQGLLPDERMLRWIEEAARAGAALPDMKVYKDEGKSLPKTGLHLKAPESRP